MFKEPNSQPSTLWPKLSAHQIHWEHRNNPHVYEYDPADDGPEVEIIQRITLSHIQKELDSEACYYGVGYVLTEGFGVTRSIGQ